MNCVILGAGAWGTALALHLDRRGNIVTLVPRRMEQALRLTSERENKDYLPGHPLPHSLQISGEVAPALMEADVVFFACPSKALRGLCGEVGKEIGGAWALRLFVVVCKGLEFESFKTPSEVVRECFPSFPCGVLSGPTYAGEVAAGKPTAVSFAFAPGFEAGAEFQQAISDTCLRAYLSEDPRGTELGATLKNVYAIAAGLCDGLELGDNARAALLTRSLEEMVRLGVALGGRRETFYGLSGFGDLVATCTGEWSRNRTFGWRVARGEVPEQIVAAQSAVVEGYRAAACLERLCSESKVEAPILTQVHDVLYGGREPAAALRALMNRTLKSE